TPAECPDVNRLAVRIVPAYAKYLLEIFENKAKSIENKQRFYERILKKIEQLEGEEKTFLLLKMFLKKMFDFKKKFKRYFIKIKNKF
ncbi:hypothetical protein PT520_12310, partial [Aliarcobacter butzleri]